MVEKVLVDEELAYKITFNRESGNMRKDKTKIDV